MTHQVAVWNQQTFAWYTDAGGEGTNQIGSTGTNPTTLVTGTQYRLRYLIQETAGSTVGEVPQFYLVYDIDGGGYNPSTSSGGDFNAVSSANVTDLGSTTQQIGAGTFTDGEFSFLDAVSGAPTSVLTGTAGSDEYECEWVINFNSSVAGSAISFRVRVEEDGAGGFLDLDTYTATTTVTPSAPVDTLLANDTESASETSSPTAVHVHDLLANDAESASEVTSPTAAQIHDLLANDAESASETQSVAVQQEHTLLADDTQSTSEVTSPTITLVTPLLADDVESASETQSVAVGQEHALLADDTQSTSETSQPVAAENAEQLIPDADTTVGNWSTNTGATVNLYQAIDEGNPPNDSDYIRSEINPSTSATKIRLSDPTGTVDTGAAHTVRYRYYKEIATGQQIDLTVRLVQGASTTIASWTHNNIGGTVVQADQGLTAPQIASITDYTDLHLEFEANAP